MSQSNERYLGFTLGEEEYGIPLLKVREVIAIPEITPVPQAPKHYLGIMNLRGQVISIIDLRQKLGITAKTGSENAVVICDIGGAQLGIVVDSVNQVHSPAADQIAERPDLSQSKSAQYITAVYRAQEKLVLFLDIAKTLDLQDQTLIKKAA